MEFLYFKSFHSFHVGSGFGPDKIPVLELLGANTSGRSETGEFRADFEVCRYVPFGKHNLEVSSTGNNLGHERVSRRLRLGFSKSFAFIVHVRFGFVLAH